MTAGKGNSLCGLLRLLLIPLASALLLRLIFLIPALLHPERLERPDTDGYWNCAQRLAETGCYGEATRAPGFPVLAAAVIRCGGGKRSAAVLLTLISIAALLPIARSAQLLSGNRAAWIAGMLWALHPTAAGNAFLLLSDTLFSLFAALQLLLFLQYRQTQKAGYFLGSIAAAALGALVRPINLPWIFVVLVLLCLTGETWKRKGLLALEAVALFGAIVTPWMVRNAHCGEGFCIDTNTGAMVHQNGAMLAAEINKSSYGTEKQRIRTELDRRFVDRKRFPDRASREAYRKKLYCRMICEHPLVWFKHHFDWKILLPDLPALTEAWGATSPGRGTLEVLKREGAAAAARHYFGNKLYLVLLLLPLAAAALAALIGFTGKIGLVLLTLKTSWYELLMMLAFIEYYLFLPGAITVPRYHLPALPLILAAAGAFFAGIRFRNKPARP